MGTSVGMYLENVRIKPQHFQAARESAAKHRNDATNLGAFLKITKIHSDGEVECVGYNYRRWYDSHLVADWLKLYCEKGGRVIFISEDDEMSWGWEFDGEGNAIEIEDFDDFTPPEEQMERAEIYQTAYLLKFALTNRSKTGQTLLEQFKAYSLKSLIELAVDTRDLELWNLLAQHVAEEIRREIQDDEEVPASSSEESSADSASAVESDSVESPQTSSTSSTTSRQKRSRQSRSSGTTSRRKKKKK